MLILTSIIIEEIERLNELKRICFVHLKKYPKDQKYKNMITKTNKTLIQIKKDLYEIIIKYLDEENNT